ncbi:MAG TPA: hypothetical protein VK021_07565 [Flavobacteriaceae bacterium]|nr:hypothetical protein [Flavobacteriaceae bacterium]
MEKHIVKITKVEPLTHDVNLIRVEKPEGYEFTPGQATEVGVNQKGWEDELRPFTFTSLNEEPFLEFNIKIYNDHDGVTKKIGTLKEGDELILHDVWGAIHYKDTGTFIAGGAGVTPFIAIFRQLEKDGKAKGNKLIFANKTEKDIIRKEDFERILGDDFINILDQEEIPKYDHGRIDADYLKKYITDLEQDFYICGPPPMIDSVQDNLKELGVEEGAFTVEL